MQTLNIPSRDKEVQLWATHGNDFMSRLAVIDSWCTGSTYSEKIGMIAHASPANFVGFVNNINSDTHGSVALVCPSGITVTGLYRTDKTGAYLVFHPSAMPAPSLDYNKNEFLHYRFPEMQSLFLHSESVCAKWWRWTTNSSVLQAFNALERRLCG